jgi:hypothetical protein
MTRQDKTRQHKTKLDKTVVDMRRLLVLVARHGWQNLHHPLRIIIIYAQ